MPTNYTPNYGLSQWEATDKVLRADFNEDNAKIDAALGTLSTDLAGKLGTMERIDFDSYNNGTLQQASVRFYLIPNFNWSDWEYVTVFHGFELVNSAGNDTITLISIDDRKTLTQFEAASFILVLFPQHNADRTLSGFVIGNGVKFFSSELTFNELTEINFYLSGGGSPGMGKIHTTILGGR